MSGPSPTPSYHPISTALFTVEFNVCYEPLFLMVWAPLDHYLSSNSLHDLDPPIHPSAISCYFFVSVTPFLFSLLDLLLHC